MYYFLKRVYLDVVVQRYIFPILSVLLYVVLICGFVVVSNAIEFFLSLFINRASNCAILWKAQNKISGLASYVKMKVRDFCHEDRCLLSWLATVVTHT